MKHEVVGAESPMGEFDEYVNTDPHKYGSKCKFGFPESRYL
jgi:hypothetical protein